MKLDKIKKYLGNFGGISPPPAVPRRCPSGCIFKNGWDSFLLCSDPWHNTTPATEESEAEYELRTQTAVGVFYGGQQ